MKKNKGFLDQNIKVYFFITKHQSNIYIMPYFVLSIDCSRIINK